MAKYRQLGLRSLFLLLVIAASFCAGWNAHKHWPARRLQQKVLDNVQANPFAADAVKEAVISGKNVSVEYAEATGMTVIKIAEPTSEVSK